MNLTIELAALIGLPLVAYCKQFNVIFSKNMAPEELV